MPNTTTPKRAPVDWNQFSPLIPGLGQTPGYDEHASPASSYYKLSTDSSPMMGLDSPFTTASATEFRHELALNQDTLTMVTGQWPSPSPVESWVGSHDTGLTHTSPAMSASPGNASGLLMQDWIHVPGSALRGAQLPHAQSPSLFFQAGNYNHQSPMTRWAQQTTEQADEQDAFAATTIQEANQRFHEYMAEVNAGANTSSSDDDASMQSTTEDNISTTSVCSSNSEPFEMLRSQSMFANERKRKLASRGSSRTSDEMGSTTSDSESDKENHQNKRRSTRPSMPNKQFEAYDIGDQFSHIKLVR